MKKTIYKLRSQGQSFGQIASQLGLSKTTVHRMYKEYCLELQINQGTPKDPEIKSEDNTENDSKSPIDFPTPDLLPEIDGLDELKLITGNDLILKEFEALEFTGKFLNLMGKPSRVFSAIIWGLPKGGKSNFSIRFADYLCEYFGSVLYIAAEEGHSQSLREKFLAIHGSEVKILECKNKDQIKYFLLKQSFDFVFIDSINIAGIEDEYLELLKKENPNTSFIAIVQATKGGNFKGSQALTHNCDLIIKVVKGVAYHEGRFGPASEELIFEGAWYEKNPNKRFENAEVKPEDSKIDKLIESEEIENTEDFADAESELKEQQVVLEGTQLKKPNEYPIDFSLLNLGPPPKSSQNPLDFLLDFKLKKPDITPPVIIQKPRPKPAPLITAVFGIALLGLWLFQGGKKNRDG